MSKRLIPTSLSVSWPLLQGFSVSYYELFVDGSTTPAIVTNIMWACGPVMTLTPAAPIPFNSLMC